jgi:hypothetical protein
MYAELMEGSFPLPFFEDDRTISVKSPPPEDIEARQ